MKGSEISTVKSILNILNDYYPAAKKIPSILFYKKVEIDLPEYFTALYVKFSSHWYIHCTDFNIWSSEEFRVLREELKEAAKIEKVNIIFAYVYYAYIEHIKVNKSSGELFIGNVKSKAHYVTN